MAELILNKLAQGVELVIAGKKYFLNLLLLLTMALLVSLFYPHPLMHKLASHTYNLIVCSVTYHNVNSA